MSEETTGTQAGSEESPAVETHQFQTEVSQLLNLLIHSLYTKREIFLRELVSNAADALNKVQFELLTQREVASRDAELAIDIAFDDEARTLTVKDTGIGMTRAELNENISTSAQSRSKAFPKDLEEQQTGGEPGAAVRRSG